MSDLKYVDIEPGNVKEAPLWFHLQGLQQTASGYGSRLTTSKMVFVQGRWRRVYVTIYSNIGTAWICIKGERFIVRGPGL